MSPARSHGRSALALLCAAQLAVTPLSARAQEAAAPAVEADEAAPDHAAAVEHFREGKRLYGERRFAEAAEAFRRSLARAWSLEATYNRALALEQGGYTVEALRTYRDYLERTKADDKDREVALERSDKLREQVGEVLLQIDSPEAIREIRINGAPVAKDAFPWLMLPGPLDVEFVGEDPGQHEAIRTDVQAGATVTIVFPGFVPPVVPPPVVTMPRPVEPPEPPISRRRRALRAGFGVTAAAALAGGVAVAVLGSRVLRYNSRQHAVCDPECDAGEAVEKDRLRGLFDDFQTATNVTIGVSAALGVAALALGLALQRERSREPAKGARLRWLGPAVELTF